MRAGGVVDPPSKLRNQQDRAEGRSNDTTGGNALTNERRTKAGLSALYRNRPDGSDVHTIAGVMPSCTAELLQQ